MMTTVGLDDEVLMLLPIIMVPLQLYLIGKILRETPFIIRESVRLFCFF
jgi:hypothetical protein